MDSKAFHQYLCSPFILVISLLASIIGIWQVLGSQSLTTILLYSLSTIALILLAAVIDIYNDLKKIRQLNSQNESNLKIIGEEKDKYKEKFDDQSDSYNRTMKENNKLKSEIKTVKSVIVAYNAKTNDAKDLLQILNSIIEKEKKDSD